MRILFVSTDMAPVPPAHYGGVERVVSEIARGMARRGHEVALLALPGSHLEGVACHFWRDWRGVPSAAGRAGQVLAIARRVAPDFCHTFSQVKWIAPWCLAGGRALISYGVLPQPRVRTFMPLLRQRVLFAGCSHYITTAGRALVGGRWETAYNCLNPAIYRHSGTVPPDAPLIFLGRIDPIKGTHLAIDVAQQTGRRLIIAGTHVEHGESGEYWFKAIKPRLNDSTITYVGPVNDEDKGALLRQASALIAPIQWDEPFGLVFIEALACGTPVISFARGAAPEIVRHGVDGFLGATLPELCQAVGRLGEIDRQTCRSRVEDSFSTEQALDRYEALYATLLAHADGGQPVS